MSILQEKIRNFLRSIDSLIPQASKIELDYAVLQKYPKIIVSFALGKAECNELFCYLENTFYFSKKRKNPKLESLLRTLQSTSIKAVKILKLNGFSRIIS